MLLRVASFKNSRHILIKIQPMYPCLTTISARKPSNAAFTLIEMLAVVVIIVVLTGITFGISKGVLNRQARAQTKAELAVIAQALEAFKLTYGDYPIASEDIATNANSRILTPALTGYSYLEPGTVQGTRVMTNVKDNEVRDSFIDVDKLNFSEPFRDPGNDLLVPNSASDLARIYLVDPWRQPYVYVYNRGSSSNSWDNPGYVLFSKGPDKEADTGSIITNGIVDQTTSNNLDNIYLSQ